MRLGGQDPAGVGLEIIPLQPLDGFDPADDGEPTPAVLRDQDRGRPARCLLDEGLALPTLTCDAEKLPFADGSFDLVSVAFGLRNMTHKDRALAEMRRVTRPGGRVLVLEDSKGYPFLQVSDGQHLVAYRVNKEAVAAGRAGDVRRIEEIRGKLDKVLPLFARARGIAPDDLPPRSQMPPRAQAPGAQPPGPPASGAAPR